MSSFDDLIATIGYLTDRQIRIALDQDYLLEKGTWEPSQLRHASYTLRLGDKVEIARAGAAALSETKEFSVVRLTAYEPKIEIRPGDTALIYSIENLRFPFSVLGFTVARGLLFAEALCPENTYVDPGFSGQIYTTITNVSGRVIHLEYGMPIARLFFFRLAEAVTNGYRTGSALGISQQLTSVRSTSFSGPDECRKATAAQLLEAVRLIPIGGIHAAESFQRRQAAERRLWITAVSWPILLLLANNSTWIKDNVGAFLGNVLASIIAGILMWVTPKVIAAIRRE